MSFSKDKIQNERKRYSPLSVESCRKRLCLDDVEEKIPSKSENSGESQPSGDTEPDYSFQNVEFHSMSSEVSSLSSSEPFKDSESTEADVLHEDESEELIEPGPSDLRDRKISSSESVNNLSDNDENKMSSELEEAAVPIENDVGEDDDNEEDKQSKIDQIEMMMSSLEDCEINEILSMNAQRNNLTATNVRSILKHIITNDYVMAMVRNTMRIAGEEGGDLEECPYEPKLTRSKAKQLRAQKAALPWPVASPVKKNSQLSTKKLLMEELADEEGSSDEEYNPNEDESHSEEETLPSENIPEEPVPPDPEYEQEFAPLIIAAPPAEQTSEIDNDDLIALRTRSKLPLTDTPLETIEASFVAPDITVDMYNTECDDDEWQQFLQDFVRPIDEKASAEGLEEDDPEYNFLEEEDVEDIIEDLDSTIDNEDIEDTEVQITQDEIEGLIGEMFEVTHEELDSFILSELYSPTQQPALPIQQEKILDKAVDSSERPRPYWMIMEEKVQVEQQMRMHVQLLAQSFLLSNDVKNLSEVADTSKAFLKEIQLFGIRNTKLGSKSTFYSHNLDDALLVVRDAQAKNSSPLKCPTNAELPNHKKQILAKSKAFLYPHLLPIRTFRSTPKLPKVKFTEAEMNLLAMGLDEFSWVKNLSTRIDYICGLLMPTKTPQQLKHRILNCRKASKPANPIQYYFKFKVAPPIPRHLRYFNPNDVKPPCELSLDVLPHWMYPYVKKPAKIAPGLPKVAVIHPSLETIAEVPEKPKFRTILPQMSSPLKLLAPRMSPLKSASPRVSPLKTISPILKKYYQHRRMFAIAPLPSDAQHSTRPAPRCTLKTLAAKPKDLQLTSANIASSTTKPSTSSNGGRCVRPLMNSELAFKQGDVLMSKSSAGMTNGHSSSETMRKLASASGSVTSARSSQRLLNAAIDKMNSGVTEIGEDEEAVDDAQDLAALMAASSTICKKPHSLTKKKNKQQRDLESTMSLLSPRLMESDPKKEARELLFAQSYLLRVVETLKDKPERCEEFLKLLCSYENCTKSPVQMFKEVKDILSDYPALVDDFVGFLLPQQARDCGKYKEYVILSKIRSFLRKMEVHFSHQPHHVQRILKTLGQLQNQKDITSPEVIATLQPLLRNQSHLMEEFLQLLPDGAPPECLMTDFEEIEIPNSDGENSSCDSVEEIVIPNTVDPYGSKHCPCTCHTSTTDVRMIAKSRHCTECGTKFIDGKIYLKTGKVLKLAKVTYHDTPSSPQPKKDTDATESRHLATSSEHPMQSTDNQQNMVPNPQYSQEQMKRLEGISTAVDESIATEGCVSFPSSVTEDAVLPPDANLSLANAPSDFSHLREVIDIPLTHTEQRLSEASPSLGGLTSFSQPNEERSLRDSPSNMLNAIPNVRTWTRDQDKIMLEVYKVHSDTPDAFKIAANAINCSNMEQVRNRFYELKELVEKHLKIQATK